MQLFSETFISELKTEISQDVFNKISCLIQKAQTPSPPTEFITRKQAANLLRVSLPTILDWTKTGKIKGYRIGSRIRYKRNEIENSLLQIKTRN
jgi:excisionase family DNA binding protein